MIRTHITEFGERWDAMMDVTVLSVLCIASSLWVECEIPTS